MGQQSEVEQWLRGRLPEPYPRCSGRRLCVTSTVGELAAAEQVKPPTMSRLVTGLEHDRLAQRGGDARDGRLVQVSPTGKGRKTLERARAKRLATLARRLGNLSPEELAVVQEAVDSLRRIVD